VVLVAPKGSGTTVRSLFLEGKGINSSYAVFQDHSKHAASKHAAERTQALGVAIGSGYFQTAVFLYCFTSEY
jgi:ketol-acid reductoisomerase